jgi:hypothetical protein
VSGVFPTGAGDPIGVTGLTEDEFDRLADYLAGALSARDEAEVAQSVRTEPRWSSARDALLRADASVRNDLRAAATPIAMPDDVVARLDAAVAAAGTGQSRSGTGTATAARATVIAIDSRRSRRRRLVLQFAGAAAAVVAVLAGVSYVYGIDSRSGTATSIPHADRAAAGNANPAAPALGAPPVFRSGRNYQPDTLGQLTRGPFAATPAPSAALNGSKGSSADEAVPGPDGLPRLSDPAALTACLAAIAQTHPGVVVVVDYARFEGTPAALVLVQQGGTETVVVVGDGCGAGGSDEKDAAVVG